MVLLLNAILLCSTKVQSTQPDRLIGPRELQEAMFALSATVTLSTSEQSAIRIPHIYWLSGFYANFSHPRGHIKPCQICLYIK